MIYLPKYLRFPALDLLGPDEKPIGRVDEVGDVTIPIEPLIDKLIVPGDGPSRAILLNHYYGRKEAKTLREGALLDGWAGVGSGSNFTWNENRLVYEFHGTGFGDGVEGQVLNFGNLLWRAEKDHSVLLRFIPDQDNVPFAKFLVALNNSSGLYGLSIYQYNDDLHYYCVDKSFGEEGFSLTGVLTAGKQYTAISTRRGNRVALYLRDDETGRVTSTSTTFTTATGDIDSGDRLILGGTFVSGSLARGIWDGKIETFLYFPRAFSEGEAFAYLDEPYRWVKDEFPLPLKRPDIGTWYTPEDLLSPELSEPGRKPTGPVEVDRSDPFADRLVAYWSFGLRGTRTHRDIVSGYVLEDTLTDSYMDVTDRGPALHFADDYVEGVGRLPDVTLSATDPISFFFLFRNISSTEDGLFEISGPFFTYNRFKKLASGVMRFSSERFSAAVNVDGTVTVDDGEWHTCAGVYVDDTHQYLYVDGRPDGSNTSTSAGSNSTAPNLLFVGREDSAPPNQWDGDVSDVLIFDRALSDEEVALLHENVYRVLRPADAFSLPLPLLPTAPAVVTLDVQDAKHDQVADLAPLAEGHQLGTQDAKHDQKSDLAPLAEGHQLGTQDAAHLQTSDGVPLAEEAAVTLDVQDAKHDQKSDLVSTAQAHVLGIESTAHVQATDTTPLAVPVPEEAADVWYAPEEYDFLEHALLEPNRKPVGPVEIRWENELTEGLKLYWPLGSYADHTRRQRDLVGWYEARPTDLNGLRFKGDPDLGGTVLNLSFTSGHIDTFKITPVDFTVDKNQPLTLFFRFKGDSGGDRGIMRFRGSGTTNQIRVYRQGTTNTIRARFEFGSTIEITATGAGTRDDEWHTSAIVQVGPALRYIYVDGILRGTNTGDPGSNTGTLSDIRMGFGYPGTSWSGSLSDFMFFDRALSADEVARLDEDPYQILRSTVPHPLQFPLLEPPPPIYLQTTDGVVDLLAPELGDRYRKPVEPVVIDWNHPMTTDLREYVLPGNGDKVVDVTGRMKYFNQKHSALSPAGTTFPASLEGQSLVYTKYVASEAIWSDLDDGPGTGDFTIAARFTLTTDANSNSYVLTWNGQVGLGIRSGEGQVYIGSSMYTGEAWTPGATHTLVAVRRAGDVRLYLDGVFKSNKFDDRDVLPSRTVILAWNMGAQYATPLHRALLWGAKWHRALTDEEIVGLSDDPYQFLRPPLDLRAPFYWQESRTITIAKSAHRPTSTLVGLTPFAIPQAFVYLLDQIDLFRPALADPGQKPEGPVVVDRDHPLAPTLYWHLEKTENHDLVSGLLLEKNPTSPTSVTGDMTKDGLYFRRVTSSDYLVSESAVVPPKVSTSAPFDFVLQIRSRGAYSDALAHPIFQWANSVGDGSPFVLVTGNPSQELRVWLDGYIWTDTVATKPWEWFTITVVGTEDGWKYCYKNGKQVAALQDVTWGNKTVDNKFWLNNGYAAGTTDPQEYAYLAYWEKAIPLGEIENLARDPYQFLRPANDLLWVPASAVTVGPPAEITLDVKGAAHLQTADEAPTEQVHALGVADAVHEQKADRAPLAELHELGTADAVHEHVVDGIPTSFKHIFRAEDAAHPHISEHVNFEIVYQFNGLDAVHLHVADRAAIEQRHDLGVLDAVHVHASDLVDLATRHDLGVLDAVHLTTSDEVPLAELHAVGVGDSVHVHASDQVVLYELGVLVIGDAIHEQRSDFVGFAQVHVLGVDSAVHLTASDEVPTAELHILPPADAVHLTASDLVALSQEHAVGVESAVHVHAVDGVPVAELHAVGVAGARHDQASDLVALSQEHAVAPADAIHVSTSDEVSLEAVHAVGIEGAVHETFADALGVDQVHEFGVLDAVHPSASDEVPLSQVYSVGVEDSVHVHVSDQGIFYPVGVLVIGNAEHVQKSDFVGFAQVHVLRVDSAVHEQAADAVPTRQKYALTAEDAVHAQVSRHVDFETVHRLRVLGAAHEQVSGGVEIVSFLQLLVGDAEHIQVAGLAGLVEENQLGVRNSVHLHYADASPAKAPPVFVEAPDERTLTVAAAPRVFEVVDQLNRECH